MDHMINSKQKQSESVESFEDNTNLVNKFKEAQDKIKQLQTRNQKYLEYLKEKSQHESTKEESVVEKESVLYRKQLKLGVGKPRLTKTNYNAIVNSDNIHRDMDQRLFTTLNVDNQGTVITGGGRQQQVINAQPRMMMCSTQQYHPAHIRSVQYQQEQIQEEHVLEADQHQQFSIKQQLYNPMDSLIQEDISLHIDTLDAPQDDQSQQLVNFQTNQSISQNQISNIQQKQSIKQLGSQKEDTKYKINTLTGTSISSNQQQISLSSEQEGNILSDEIFEGENIAQFVLNLETVSPRWGAQERRKFEIAISCLGVAKVSKVDIIQQYAKANQPRERYVVHRQQYIKQLVKDWNLKSNQEIKNYMYDRQSPNNEILSKICEQWKDPKFTGFTAEQINNFLHE